MAFLTIENKSNQNLFLDVQICMQNPYAPTELPAVYNNYKVKNMSLPAGSKKRVSEIFNIQQNRFSNLQGKILDVQVTNSAKKVAPGIIEVFIESKEVKLSSEFVFLSFTILDKNPDKVYKHFMLPPDDWEDTLKEGLPFIICTFLIFLSFFYVITKAESKQV